MPVRFSAALCGLFLVLGPIVGVQAVEQIDASDLAVQVEIKMNTDTIAFGHGALWASRQFDVIRIDEDNFQVTKTEVWDGSRYLRPPVIGSRAVWLPDVGANLITKIDPDTGTIIDRLSVEMIGYESIIGVGEDALWVVTAANLEKQIARIDQETGRIVATVELPGSGASVAFGHGFVWVTNKFQSELYKIDPTTNTVTSTIELDGAPVHIAAGEGAVWVRDELDGSVIRIDPANHAIRRIETELHGSKGNIVTGGGYVWVLAESRTGRAIVAQIDPRANTLARTYKVGRTGRYISFGSNSLWISGPTVRKITPRE